MAWMRGVDHCSAAVRLRDADPTELTGRARGAGYGPVAMGPSGDSDELVGVLGAVADAIAEILAASDDWGLAGTRPGQYVSDIAADAVAVEQLVAAGFGVLSEETGRHHPERAVT